MRSGSSRQRAARGYIYSYQRTLAHIVVTHHHHIVRMISILVVFTLFKGSFGSNVPVGLYQQFPSPSSGEGTGANQVFGPFGTGGPNFRNVGSGPGTPQLVLTGQERPSQGSSPGANNPGTPEPNNVNVFGTPSQSYGNLRLVFSNQAQAVSEQGSLTTGTLPLQGSFFPGSSNPGNLFLQSNVPSSQENPQVFLGSGPEPPVVQAVNLNEDDSSANPEIISFTTYTDTVTVSHTIVTGTTVLEPDYTTTTQTIAFSTTNTMRIYVPDDATTSTFTLTSTITNIQTTTTETDGTWSTSTTTTEILISTTPREYDLKLTKLVTTFKIVPIVKYTTISLTEVLTVKVPSTTTVVSAASRLVTRAY